MTPTHKATGDVHVGRDVRGDVVVGTKTVIYQGTHITIPSADAIAAHRQALRRCLAQEARSRWGEMSTYIQEAGATLPLEVSPYQQERLGQRADLLETLKAADRLLVLGEPGAGKTVALERLAWELCDGGAPTVPVLVKLFDYTGGVSIPERVWGSLKGTGLLRLDDVTSMEALLSTDDICCVCMFDGLNEVPSEYRRQVVEELRFWAIAHPQHPVILTSRAQDEVWRQLRADVRQTMVVQPIADKQARAYLGAHLQARGRALYDRLDPRLRAMARRPLILWLIKEAGAAGEEYIPGNRGELYAHFIARMLRRDTERRMDAEIPVALKRQVLAALAYHLSQEQRLVCQREEAVSSVAAKWGRETARAVLGACMRHGLLAGDDLVWFAPHQTVQEYFTAAALQARWKAEQQQPRLKRWWARLRGESVVTLAAEDWWAEPFVQLAGLVDADPRTGADALARDLARINPWLAWWCVEEGQGVSDATRDEVEARSIKMLQSERVADRRRAVSTLAKIRNERVVAPLLRAVGDEDAEVTQTALRALRDVGEGAHRCVRQALRSQDAQQRETALRYLRGQPEHPLWLDASERLWEAMHVEDRRRAVSALAQIRNERVVAPLFRAAGDGDAEVSLAAALALEEFSEVVKPLMFEALSGGGEQWQQRAALRFAISQPTDTDIVPPGFWMQTLGVEVVYVPPGPFLMGSDKEKDTWARDNELPQHDVTLPGYWISKALVTVAQFQRFVAESGYKWPRRDWKQGGDDHPVVYVDWYDAMAYCRWLAERTGLPVTLPSEAEWEKAARGPEGQLYPWGDAVPDAGRCNFGENVGGTTPVGQYSPAGDSYYGCWDMAGNVWEWTRSLDKRYPYRVDDGREDVEKDNTRILRGGAYYSGKDSVRCAYRSRSSPLNGFGDSYGFRWVVSPSPALHSGTLHSGTLE